MFRTNVEGPDYFLCCTYLKRKSVRTAVYENIMAVSCFVYSKGGSTDRNFN